MVLPRIGYKKARNRMYYIWKNRSIKNFRVWVNGNGKSLEEIRKYW